MLKQARSLAPSLALCVTLVGALAGCHSNPNPAPGSVTVRMPDGSTQVIAAGQPVPVGATVIASGSTAPAGQAAPVAPPSTAADAPVAPGTVALPGAPAVAGTAISPTPVPARAPVVAPTPRPALVVPAGTHVTIRTTEALSAEHGGGVGSGFSGVLNAPVVVHGATAFPRGTTVRGEIASAQGRGHFAGRGDLGVVLTRIGGYPVETSEYVASVKGRGKRTAGFIGGGAGLGALIGGIAGGGKGAAIGALSGGGAGTAAGALTGSRDVVIPSESAISFTLRNSITLK